VNVFQFLSFELHTGSTYMYVQLINGIIILLLINNEVILKQHYNIYLF